MMRNTMNVEPRATSRHSVDFLCEVMRRPTIAGMLQEAKDVLKRDPDACVTIGQNSAVQIRVGGKKRSWVSMRALMWMQDNYLHGNGYPAPPTFGTPTCSTPGCVNPRHQQERGEPQLQVKVVRTNAESV